MVVPTTPSTSLSHYIVPPLLCHTQLAFSTLHFSPSSNQKPHSSMELPKILMIITTLVLLNSHSTTSQTVGSPSPSPLPSPPPSPAPAPAPDFVNLAALLSVAGPFQKFLNYLQSTQVIKTLQDQANNTQQGITIFVPKDVAFSSLKKPSLSNLTQDQLKSLLLFHALPQYYTLSDFKSLSGSGPVSTLAGGSYTLNFTDVTGTVHVSSGWSNTNVSSSVHSTDPVALYQVDKVLLPEAIFGAPPPPSPAPAPAPDIAPAGDAISDGSGDGSSSKSSTSASSYRTRFRALDGLVLVVFTGFIVWL
ncbi:fasciclin-like arabinogalactan protein 7 [Magnolia sinica]|uniref:fasciclin-like arabinogalactan protein 7 n=1 Tax=Magnolia sinica TaxID=86752 RepID=UPI0026595924|nr:fasciclin-like arabinogalactan protein 7 [Magnolia sinica]